MSYYPYYQPQTPQNQFYGAQQQSQPLNQFIQQQPQNGSYALPQQQINPFVQVTPQQQTQQASIEYVNGIEGAKAYIMQPNSTKWLMDSDGNYFYLKSSNAQNQASVRMYEYKEIDIATKKEKEQEKKQDIDMSCFVKKEDFDALKKVVASLKKSRQMKVLGDEEDE